MTVKGGTSQACAACKYQRRKCSNDCPLSPYFPPDNPKQFQNAHRLFGVSNILKILKQIDPNMKADAMRSIIYQSNIRERFPVHGCLAVIWILQQQVQTVHTELECINSQLAFCRQKQGHVQSQPLQNSTAGTSSMMPMVSHASGSGVNLIQDLMPMVSHASGSGVNLIQDPFSQSYGDLNPSIPIPLNNSFLGVENFGNPNDNNLNPSWTQQPFNNSSGFQNPVLPPQVQPFPSGGIEEISGYDLSPIFDSMDDPSTFIDNKEAYEASQHLTLKDTLAPVDQVSGVDLTNAAACFRLTSDTR